MSNPLANFPQKFIRMCGIGLLMTGSTIWLTLQATEMRTSPRVVAVGDIHGDFSSLVTILQHAGIIDDQHRWTGGNTTLVQTGDFLDRGPKARDVMDLLMGLEKQAAKQGGEVVVLLGNHEIMNLVGDLRFVPSDSVVARIECATFCASNT